MIMKVMYFFALGRQKREIREIISVLYKESRTKKIRKILHDRTEESLTETNTSSRPWGFTSMIFFVKQDLDSINSCLPCP